MNKSEAIRLLRRYQREEIQYYRFKWPLRGYEEVRSVYERILVQTLIRKIRASDRPPLVVIHDFYTMMDDVLCESDDDHFITHSFASIMENCTGDILRYLKKEGSDESI